MDAEGPLETGEAGSRHDDVLQRHIHNHDVNENTVLYHKVSPNLTPEHHNIAHLLGAISQYILSRILQKLNWKFTRYRSSIDASYRVIYSLLTK